MRLLVFIFFFPIFLKAQEIKLLSQDSLTAKYDVFWGKDVVGCTYFSKQNDVFKVCDNHVANFTSNLGGKLTNVDVFNSLNVFLFYKNTNTIVVLDKQTNPIKSVTSTAILFDFVTPASQNDFWFYDNFTQKIGLYNLNTDSHRMISNIIQNKIIYAHSDYNSFYWIDDTFTYYSIDKFGKIKNLGVVPTFEQISFDSFDKWLLLKENQIWFYDYNQKKLKALHIEEKIIKNFCFKDGILAIFTENLIRNYQLKFE